MECDASKWGWCCTACIWRHTTPSRAGTKLGRDAPPLRRQTRRVDAGRAVRRAVLVDPRANDSQKRLDSRSPTKPRVQLALMGHQRVLASARSGVPDGAVPDHHAAHGGSDEHRREWIARVRDRRGGWGRQEGATQQVGDNRRRDGRSSPSWAERRARRGSYCTPPSCVCDAVGASAPISTSVSGATECRRNPAVDRASQGETETGVRGQAYQLIRR